VPGTKNGTRNGTKNGTNFGRFGTLVGTRGLWGKNKSFSADIGKNKEDLIYKIQIHSCKTDAVDDYVALAEQNIRQISENEDIPQKLIGSFRVWYGKQDEIIHIWQYEGGYAALDEAASKTADLDSYNKYRAERAQMLKQRTNQLLVQFNYMPDPIPRDGKNIYELRSYKLRSGTQGEWSFSWTQNGMKCRAKDEAVTGLFTNAGPLNIVHHLWCYEGMKHREVCRKDLWEYEAWSNHVRNTTPLIQDHESRILHPLPWSPLQ